MRTVEFYASAALLALGASTAAHAQSTTPGDQPAATPTQGTRTTSYDAAFFAQYAPRSALDIARRVPGFNLDLGATEDGADVRGFAGTAGNVVFNGARPSSKAESLETTLARIPAQRVTKSRSGPATCSVLLLRQEPGAEHLLSSGSGIDANVTASTRRLYTGKMTGDVSGSALIRRGLSSINLSAGTGYTLNKEEGTDTLTDMDTDELYEHRRNSTDMRIQSYLPVAGAGARRG